VALEVDREIAIPFAENDFRYLLTPAAERAHRLMPVLTKTRKLRIGGISFSLEQTLPIKAQLQRKPSVGSRRGHGKDGDSR
jgi:hypothetical protein